MLSINFLQYFDVDVVFLTLILQSVGFRLDNFEFAGKTEGITTNDLKIRIKCEKTGLTSNMSFDTNNCTCPEKKQNSAFWEVQGSAPQGSAPHTPKKKDTIIEKSSSFIPEISKNCSNILKNCMTDLINYLDNEVNNLNKSPSDLSNVKQFIEKLNSDSLHSKIQDCAYTHTIKNIKIEKTPEERTAPMFVTPFTTPLSSINITPVNIPAIAPKILINDSNKCSTPPAEGFDNSISPFDLNNKTSNLITSSPNNDQSRDANIMQAIIDAKQKLDSALIFLKLNLTHTIDSTSFTMTPRALGQTTELKVNQSSISRRQSTGSTLNSRSIYFLLIGFRIFINFFFVF